MIFGKLKKQLNADYAPEPDQDRIEKLTRSFTSQIMNERPDQVARSIAESMDFHMGLKEFWEGMYLLSDPKISESIKKHLL